MDSSYRVHNRDTGVGLQDLWMRIQQHGDYLIASGSLHAGVETEGGIS
jgi:hypothetical protein